MHQKVESTRVESSMVAVGTRTRFVNMRKNWEKWFDGTQDVHCGWFDGTQDVHCGEGLLDQWSQKFEPLPMWLKFGT